MALGYLWERSAGNSVQCTVCIKWIHKQCSGVHGNLSLLAGDLVVNGETYGCV